VLQSGLRRRATAAGAIDENACSGAFGGGAANAIGLRWRNCGSTASEGGRARRALGCDDGVADSSGLRWRLRMQSAYGGATAALRRAREGERGERWGRPTVSRQQKAAGARRAPKRYYDPERDYDPKPLRGTAST
jgi:hypothetical protein